jgi:uncharacterized membrane protein
MTETPPSAGPEPRPKRRFWLRALLFVSLALNLAVIGVVGGAMLGKSKRDDAPARVSRELGLGPFLAAMEQADRQVLYKMTRERSGDLKAGRSQWRAAFDESFEVLRADPFDTSRMRALIAQQEQAATAGRRLGQDVLLEHLSTMTLEERRDFADRLEQAMRRGRDGKPNDHARQPPPHR